MLSWDSYFIKLCHTIATKSKDRSTKLGCIIVGPGHEIRSTGYNGFPRGVNDNVDARHQRPAKYLWTEHSERNAIFNAARCGVAVEGCTMYCPWLPCARCARAIVNAGISDLVVETLRIPERWKEEMIIALTMMQEAAIGLWLPDRKWVRINDLLRQY